MKSYITGIFVCVCVVVGWSVCAEENPPEQAFQRGNAYIRYSLTSDALSSLRNGPSATFTLTPATINAIDAYFEFDPTLPYGEISEPPLLEVNAESGIANCHGYALSSPAESLSLTSTPPSWSIGDVSVKLDYKNSSLASMFGDSWPSQSERQSLWGRLFFPFGQTGFSLKASIGMHAAQARRSAYTESLQAEQYSASSARIDIPETMGYTATDAGDGALSLSSNSVESESDQSFETLFGTQNTVAGIVNVGGVIRDVQIFTEVGVASGNEEYTDTTISGDTAINHFYASGGANYTVGQVTLGLEAGFESGEDITYNTESLGFESDFFLENLLPESSIEGQTAANRVYASVSAKLSPTERVTVGGTVKYVQRLSETVEPYGFEVDGTLYYSLTNYLKYLAQAGMSSADDSDDAQYRLRQILEVTF